MKNPADLSRDELIAIAAGLLQILYGREHENGTWTYAADKEWSGGDVCEAAASLLGRFGLVPETDGDGELMESALPENQAEDDQIPRYALKIDGPQLRAQRQLLLKLMPWVKRQTPLVSDPDHENLLNGLINLTDEIADQAHDNYGVDCLIDEKDGPCDCQQPGYFCSGVPGIIARIENGRLAKGAKVERCDLCQRYPSDEAALERLRELGYVDP
jgi:hypothetical protein